MSIKSFKTKIIGITMLFCMMLMFSACSDGHVPSPTVPLGLDFRFTGSSSNWNDRVRNYSWNTSNTTLNLVERKVISAKECCLCRNI